MKTFELKNYGVSELSYIDTINIDGGFDKDAYNAGKEVGQLVGRVIAGVLILAAFF